jgi:hypothetical protein
MREFTIITIELIIIVIMSWWFGWVVRGTFEEKWQWDARLKTSEAANTVAQQPQERHYFTVCDSAVVAGKISK